MNALICLEPGKFEYADVAEPQMKAGHAIVRIRNIGICGTDLHAFEGTQPFFSYPRILGHELSGELVDFDDAPGFHRGEAVTFLPYLNCGDCVACRAGKTNCCVKLRVCGVHIDGGMVDYYSIPSRLLVHSHGLDLLDLALVEPMSIGAHGVRRAGVQPGEFVLVMGAGPIGMATIEFAKLKDAKIIVLDKNPYRLEFCRNMPGVLNVIHASDHNIVEQLSEITHGDLPTVVFDASGNQAAIHNGLNYLAYGGRYILIGLQKEKLVFSHPEFHKREVTLMSSRNATRDDFEYVIQTMVNKQINHRSFITNRVQFNDAASGFSDWLSPSNHIIKVVVEKD
ncbi:MAG TPA: zinc-binding alcohol dehydrogenase family protein [Puia sp.]|jgi:2-desacetyl-2-hydroxyethyl bacteriochlorophyllide A dehydrogenase